MAGHSKWANIRHRKNRQDAKRGKLFTKLIRELTVAARLGGADPDSNPKLRTALDKALAANMTKDTISRAIKRGAGGEDGATLEQVRYEGYGPCGVAVLVECLTDNRNRAVASVRHIFSKAGGNLGTEGSVAYLFSQQGLINLPAGSEEDKVMNVALEAGAEDIVSNDDGSIDVTTDSEGFYSVKNALAEVGLSVENAELVMVASTQVPLDKDEAEKVLRLTEFLEDLDDVQDVYTNADIAEEILAAL